MSAHADAHDLLFDEIHGLILAGERGDLTAAGVERLERLVREDPRARRLYAQYALETASLRVWAASPQSAPSVLLIDRANEEAKPATAPTWIPGLRTLSTGWGGYLGDHPMLSGYLVATVLFVVAGVIGLTVRVSLSLPATGAVVENSRGLTAPGEPAAGKGGPEETQPVGRITGLVDCQWADPEAARAGREPSVPLGRQYALSSGLMEISYNSGAKVILQGPCTYEVESPRGGYLSLGKLTARVEKSEVRNQKSEISNPQSLIPNPLFVVRTPTATITDLGTEFGVEVNRQGEVAAHVLQGKVEVRLIEDGSNLSSSAGGEQAGHGDPGRSIQAVAGESVRVVKAADGHGPAIIRGKADAAAFPATPGRLAEFVEQERLKPFHKWRAYSQELRKDPALVAYYTFESRGRDPMREPSILPNLAATGEALDGRIKGPRWTDGRFPGKSALRFSGSDWSDRVELPQPERFHFTGPFSVAVWFQTAQFTTKHQALIAKGDSEWRVQRSNAPAALDRLRFCTEVGTGSHQAMDGSGEVADGQWHLSVVVWAPAGGQANKRLYLDGRLDAEGQSPLALQHSDDPVWLGNNSAYPDRAWNGLIDEVAIFSRALSGKEIEEMFAVGKPAGADGSQAVNLSQSLKKEAKR